MEINIIPYTFIVVLKYDNMNKCFSLFFVILEEKSMFFKIIQMF